MSRLKVPGGHLIGIIPNPKIEEPRRETKVKTEPKQSAHKTVMKSGK